MLLVLEESVSPNYILDEQRIGVTDMVNNTHLTSPKVFIRFS